MRTGAGCFVDKYIKAALMPGDICALIGEPRKPKENISFVVIAVAHYLQEPMEMHPFTNVRFTKYDQAASTNPQ